MDLIHLLVSAASTHTQIWTYYTETHGVRDLEDKVWEPADGVGGGTTISLTRSIARAHDAHGCHLST